MSGHMLIVNSAATEFRGMVADDFGPFDVECASCGDKDNHCRNRRGLCINCYCALANKVGEEAFAAMPKGELVREARAARLAAVARGTSPLTKATRDAEHMAEVEAAEKAAANGDADAMDILAREKARLKKQRQNAKRAAARAAARVAKYGSGFRCAGKSPAKTTK